MLAYHPRLGADYWYWSPETGSALRLFARLAGKPFFPAARTTESLQYAAQTRGPRTTEVPLSVSFCSPEPPEPVQCVQHVQQVAQHLRRATEKEEALE